MLEVSLLLGIHMQRPKRQAAQDAIAKIRDIREWETLPEASQRFQECAAIIDAELESEIKKKKVKTCDLDVSDSEDEADGEVDDKYYDADDGFVVADNQISDVDPDFCLNENEKNMLENETEDETSDEGCDEASDEDFLSQVSEISESEEGSEVDSGDESQDKSQDEEEEQWEDAREQFEPVQCEPGQGEANVCEQIQCEPSPCEQLV